MSSIAAGFRAVARDVAPDLAADLANAPAAIEGAFAPVVDATRPGLADAYAKTQQMMSGFSARASALMGQLTGAQTAATQSAADAAAARSQLAAAQAAAASSGTMNG